MKKKPLKIFCLFIVPGNSGKFLWQVPDLKTEPYPPYAALGTLPRRGGIRAGVAGGTPQHWTQPRHFVILPFPF